jgi:PIN domain nuclease of toxin-antitoxin system
MIILDTCVLIFDALTPDKISATAKKIINHSEKDNELYCCEISLWEIAMLIEKKRLDPGTDTGNFLNLILQARNIASLGINIEIATVSASHTGFKHFDPVDRIIAATAISNDAKLVTCDKHLRHVDGLTVIW